MRKVTKTEGVEKEDHTRTEGAIVAFRAALCNTEVVTAKRWYSTVSPCTGDQDSVLGVASQGYGNETKLNDTPEYVICNPKLCVPIAMAIFKNKD